MLTIIMKGPSASGKSMSTRAIIKALENWAFIEVHHIYEGEIFKTDHYGNPDSRHRISITEETTFE